MKITLVNLSMWVKKKEFYGVTPPLGLCYIAGMLEKEGYNVNIIDGQVEKDKDEAVEKNGFIRVGISIEGLSKLIARSAPDIIGLSCPLSIMWEDVSKLSRLLKNDSPNSFQVLGGFHPSAFPQECLRDSKVDCIVIGEGEITFLEVVNRISQKQNPFNSNGIAFINENGVPVKNQPREHIKNLDLIPFPARHMIDLEKYIKINKSQGGQKRYRYTTVITSRGCPNDCIFCSVKVVWGRGWRARSPENVVEELEELKNKYKINEIHFEDDNISLNKKRMNRLCDLIIEKDLDMTWTTPNGIAVHTLDKELLIKMKKSGCHQLNFGIESGNEFILSSVIRKNLRLAKAREVIAWTKEAGIWAHGFFVIGFPGETHKMIQDTLNFANTSNLDSAFFTIATPYPGTELFDILVSMGKKIDRNSFLKLRSMDCAVGTDFFTSEELVELQKAVYKNFFIYRFYKEMNPINIIKRLKDIDSKDDINYYLKKVTRLEHIW